MKIPEIKKHEYWDYYTSEPFKTYRPRGITDLRLQKIKSVIWGWDYFWDDVVVRHGGLDVKPTQMDKDTFDHSIGNFYGMMYEAMMKTGIIKP